MDIRREAKRKVFEAFCRIGFADPQNTAGLSLSEVIKIQGRIAWL